MSEPIPTPLTDALWSQDGPNADYMGLCVQLEQQLASITARHNQFVADMGTTCFACEACGHARTSKGCVHCQLAAMTAERESLFESNCVLQSQIDNADATLEMARSALRAQLAEVNKRREEALFSNAQLASELDQKCAQLAEAQAGVAVIREALKCMIENCQQYLEERPTSERDDYNPSYVSPLTQANKALESTAGAQLLEERERLRKALGEAVDYLTSNPPADGWGLLDHGADKERKEVIQIIRAAMKGDT